MKKIFVFIAVLLLPILTACNKDDAIRLEVYSQLANFSGEQQGFAREVFLEEFNVILTIINDVDGTYATRMEDGFLGDIVIFGSSGRDYRNAVEAGMLFNWEEDNLVQEHGPYIWEHMQYALAKNRGLVEGYNNIYGFGHDVAGSGEDTEDFMYYPYIRWDLYQQLGMPPINTLEDFIPVLEAMVALEPVNAFGQRNYGVSSFTDWDGDMVMMVKSTGALYGYDEFGFGLYDTRTQTYQPIFAEDSMYLRALRFYNQLHQRGLFDPDSMAQTWNDVTEKYLTGRAMFNIFDYIGEYFNTEEHMASGRAMMCVAAADQENIVYGLNPYGQNRIWSIGAQSAHPELAMEIINWLCTPDGVLTYNYGPRGLMWDYDEDGYTYLTELGMAAQNDKENTMLTFNNYSGSYRDGEFQHNNPTWNIDAVNPESPVGESFNWKRWRSTLETRVIYPVEQSWRDHYNALRADDYLEDRGHMSLSVGTMFEMNAEDVRDSTLDLVWEQVGLVIRNGSWSAMIADTDAEYEAIVAQMIADAIAFGYNDCIEWNQGQAVLRRAAEDAARGR